jgi:predicted restriction endonuclease
MDSFQKKYYLAEVSKTRCGNSRGRIVNAKPLFVLSIIQAIENKHLLNNRFFHSDEILKGLYLSACQQYEPQYNPSPFILPFYHLSKDSYYDIKWSGKPFNPSPHAHSPSAKYLNDNAEYAFFDEAFWELLQDASVREEFKELIINFFIRKKTE